ncbi:hypothetical protein PGQ11_013204 [Apiospora arundinis]|uniref:DUF7918 domain-containing protein n=1 Tax=Apiospora arundinis TaxID=335852 RepID=A0ABR2I599_9PEZI
MAIIEGLEGLEAWVEINGQRAQEYDKPDDDGDSNDLEVLVAATKVTNPVSLEVKDIPHVVKYIEAIPDSNFSIEFNKAEGFRSNCNHLGVKYIIDDTPTDIAHEPQNRSQMATEWYNGCCSIVTGSDNIGWTNHYFKFGDVKHIEGGPVSEELLNKTMREAKSYGLIAVKVFRMSASAVENDDYCDEEELRGLPQEIPEKATKGAAITTCTAFERAPGSKPDAENEDIFQDPSKRPCAVFEFCYRSREGLYQEGILERPDAVDLIAPDELRRLARNWLNQENKVKQENGGTALDRKRSASRTIEPARKRYKETVRGDGKTEIDLD